MADEEVTDLTEGEEDSGTADTGKKKGKAPKKEKEPKAPKEPKEKKAKGKKEKGGGIGGLILIMVLILLILIGGFGALLYFDMFDARMIIADVVTEPLLGIIIWLDPGYSTIDQRLRAEAEAQDKRIAELYEALDERELDIEFLEGVLDTREQLLDRREFDLDRREDHIVAMYERTVPLYRRDMSEQELEDMISLSRTYTQMAPSTAANVLVQLHDPRDVAAILYFMSERNAAAILAEMNVDYAAEITEILLYS